MTDKTQVVVDLPEHQYLNVANEKPLDESTTVQTKPAPKITDIGSIVGLIIFILAAAIPILQLYIGRRYADDCPLDWHIPHYLIIAGIVGIAVIILGIIENVLALKISTNLAEQTPSKFSAAMFLCIVSLVITLIFFLFVWFVAGCYWLFRSWKIVQYVDSDHSDYCHPVLYRFAFWSIIIALIFKILSCCQSSSKVADILKKRKTTNIPKIVINSRTI